MVVHRNSLKMKRKIHINLDWRSESLCGRIIDFNSAWLTKVQKYLKSYPKTVWCKNCKNVYNATHEKKLLS